MDLVKEKEQLEYEAQDETFKCCPKCGDRWLYAYWDHELEAYIYLTEEGEQRCCKCRKMKNE
jgi:hypothetical protein